MGEKLFISYTINSAEDVEVIKAGVFAQIQKAGEGLAVAVGEKVAASLGGDLAAAAAAQTKIVQYDEALEALAQVVKNANEWQPEKVS